MNYNTSTDWTEATKVNPCPLCGKPDWCSVSDNGEAVLCRRTDSAPVGWKHIKDSQDGYPIYVLDNQQPRNTQVINTRHKRQRQAKVKPAPIPQGLPIARFPEIPSDIPQKVDIAGIPTEAKKAVNKKNPPTNTQFWQIIYLYSENQRVYRFEWEDSNKPKGKDKVTLPFHKSIKWEIGKGDQRWKAYRLDECVLYGKGKWVIGAEGEPCVENYRSLGLPAFTFQGGSWTEEDIESGLTFLKTEGVAGVIYHRDHDDEGKRKAEKVAAIAAKVGLPFLVVEPIDLYEFMPQSGDVVDAVAAMGDDEVVRRLEEIKAQLEATYQQSPEDESDFADAGFDIPNSFDPDVEFNQFAFKVLYRDRPWISVDNQLYGWNDTYYKLSKDAIELKRCADFCNSYMVLRGRGINAIPTYPYAKPTAAKQLLEWVKIRLAVDPDLVNPPGLNCTNGVLQLNWNGDQPSWELIDHTPDFYYLYEPVATFNPDAPNDACDRLLSVLDAPQREIFLRTIASSLDLATVRKYKGRLVRGLLLKGDGSNGKDTLRECVAAMYGYQGMTGCTLSDFKAYDDGRKFPLSRLKNSRVNWATENANTAQLDRLQSIKAFLTGDTLSKEGKGKDEVDYTPMGVGFFNCNDTPNLQASLEAIQSRWGVLTFNKTFKIGADPAKGEIEADPRFKYDPEFLRTLVLPAFLNRVLAALVNLMRDGIDYSCTHQALEDIQAQNSHLFQFCQDTGLGYVPEGILTAKDIWTRLESWYQENDTLTYEEQANGKMKAIWQDQVKKSDSNVKAPNQVIARFQALFPKAKRISFGKGQVALQGIGFAGEAVEAVGEAMVRQSVSLESLPNKDGEPITPIPSSEKDFENGNDVIQLVESSNSEQSIQSDNLLRLTHHLDVASISALPTDLPKEAIASFDVTSKGAILPKELAAITAKLDACTCESDLEPLYAQYTPEQLKTAACRLSQDKKAQLKEWVTVIKSANLQTFPTPNEKIEVKCTVMLNWEGSPHNSKKGTVTNIDLETGEVDIQFEVPIYPLSFPIEKLVKVQE
jgi:putative DNA primase/helicase